ncbi:MAG TPA: CHAT domain-containing protein [Candidatus Dormibacteraeota bacterium]|nr:CHAT domain-containing protein [Candidatus Dormibacteraeota bacterium]
MARRIARAVLDGPGADPLTRATAERALGIAARELDDVDTALAHLRAAIATAEGAGLQAVAAEARVSLFGLLGVAGDIAGALREAGIAERHLRGGPLGVLILQRGNVHQIRGDLDAALAEYRRALPRLRRAGDRANLARLHTNRGMALAARGDQAAASLDLVAAVRLHELAGNHRLAAQTRQNVGLAVARRGDIVEALRWFAAADEYFASRGEVDGVGLLDRADALLQARLVGEARATAASAIRHLTAQRRSTYVADARLLLGEAILLDGDPEASRAAATEAQAAFAAQGRPVLVARASHLHVRAAAHAASDAALADEAAGTADALERAGWIGDAVDARLIAARAAMAAGRREMALLQLGRAKTARRRGPAAQRARAWHAEALLRLGTGDAGGATAAVRAGMRIIEANRDAIAATDLRAHASAHGEELARLGLQLAIDAGDPVGAFRWAERGRAGAMASPPARPPADAALASDLDTLRQAVKEVDDAAVAGRDTRAALMRQARLEEAVRRRTRTRAGAAGPTGPSATADAPSPAELRRALGGDALLELVAVGGRLHAAVVCRAGLRWFELGAMETAVAETAGLRFARRRLAIGRGTRASLEAARAAARHAAERLDEIVVAPLRGTLGSRGVVVVPTGALHGVPFAALPSLLGRAVSVAPSAALWLRAASAGSEASGRPAVARVVAIAAPGVPGADAEARMVGRLHPGRRLLRGSRARCRAVLRAMDGATLAHVAAHGVFRADNPLFSHLQLADGPLMVYDIEALATPPRVLVLSACDAAVSDVRPGDELMGLAAGLLTAGVRTVVAPLGAVPHETALALMTELHTRMRGGAGPALALGEAQRHLLEASPEMAGVVDFVCLGDGTRPIDGMAPEG